jgi:hypothetical protein
MRACVRAAVALLPTVAAAVLIGTPGRAQPAQATRPEAQTMEQRLRAIEAKTGFYTASTRKIPAKYRKGQSNPPCSNKRAMAQINPKLALGGDLYLWPTLTVRLAGFPGPDRILKLSIVSTAQKSCDVVVEVASANAQLPLKSYCKLDVAPAEKITFTFELGNDSGPVDACEYISSVDLSVKLLSIGVSEPK